MIDDSVKMVWKRSNLKAAFMIIQEPLQNYAIYRDTMRKSPHASGM